MRRRLTFAVFMLTLSVLACNVPRPGGVGVLPTGVPAATELARTEAPPTASPSTELPVAEEPTATPTSEGPTSTPVPEETLPTMTPSSTPIIMCTPPACNEGEVYYCEGECPGGCGTQCATPTPATPSAPVILSFTADRTAIVQGESVDLTWRATGGTEAHICWVTHEAIMACVPGPVDPDGGTETVTPTAPGRPGVADFVLTVKNSAGAAEAHVDVTIACAEDPLPALADQQLFRNCPYGTVVGNAAYQAFGGGDMIWLEGNSTIYVLYADGRYESYADDFHEGDPESDPSITPPEGLLQPVRGFGLVWRTNPAVRDGLGWALAPEEGFQGWSQSYSGLGMHNSGTFLRFIDGSVVLLLHFGATWRFVTP
jgi:hypothetical protein